MEENFKTKKFWDDLSYDDRTKLLQEHHFWNGFKAYLYEYIPEDLKVVISLKMDIND